MTSLSHASRTALADSVSERAGLAARDLSAAAAAAVAGGRAVMRRYRAEGDVLVEDEGRGPVTTADRDSHAAILAELARLAPGDPVRSEEGGRDVEPGPGGRLWIVDPLDGTREFLDRVEEFSVLVGLAEDGRARLGAVYVPAADVLFLGVAEGGAWVVREAGSPGRRAEPIAVREPAPAPLRRLESRSHPDPRLDRLGRILARHGVACRTTPAGSAGTKCARVASGEADLYVHPVPHLKEWDTCAGEAVARGAGARVTDCAGAGLVYGKPDPRHPEGLLVASPAVWETVLPMVVASGAAE